MLGTTQHQGTPRPNDSPRTIRAWSTACMLALAVVVGPVTSHSQSFTVLYTFLCGADGASPKSTPLLDAAGNLFGTTVGGGSEGSGTVFQVGQGGVETVLHSFGGQPSDGGEPEFDGLTLDQAGNLYGTTPQGGSNGAGVAFKLAPDRTESILHNFLGSSRDGYEPFGTLLLDAQGNLYGTASGGGDALCSNGGCGIIFKLAPSLKESRLYTFTPAPDAGTPIAGLIRDARGNFYGTTEHGGSRNVGAVFELSASGTESVLHSFLGSDGSSPMAGLVRDSAGRLYGTAPFGGSSGFGTVFVVTPTGRAKVLHTFRGAPNGATPYGGLVRDGSGNLYGLTYGGGSGPCNDGYELGCGEIFELSPTGQETVLYSFTGTTDGEYPFAGLARDDAGNLYGTTSQGGANGCGTVFKFTP